MDRITFFNSISGIDYPEMIVEFFDQFIALKQLVDDHGTVSVCDKSDNSISFITVFNDKKFKDQALYTVGSGPITIYGRPISISVENLSDTEIKFILQ